MNQTTHPVAVEPVATEIDVGSGAPAPSPMRKIILLALGLLLILFVYHVLSDRFTPYTSQARVETFLTQIAPEVAGDVLEVGAKDNGAVKKGQLLFSIDPEPYEVAVRSAEANLSVALQAADVSVADVAAARAQITKQRADLSASRQLGGIVDSLVGQKGLARNTGYSSSSGQREVAGRPDASSSGSEESTGQSRRARIAQSQGPSGACSIGPGAPGPTQ